MKVGPCLAKGTNSNEAYPLLSREYALSRGIAKVVGDIWLLELSYDEIADYLPQMSLASQQRLAFVAELL
jgi:hypothetical protein